MAKPFVWGPFSSSWTSLLLSSTAHATQNLNYPAHTDSLGMKVSHFELMYNAEVHRATLL